MAPVAAKASLPEQEETCQGDSCSERDINAPVGVQAEEAPVDDYDSIAGNPARSTLRFPIFDPSWSLSRAIFEKAMHYFEQNKNSIPNPRYFMVVDFNLHSSKKRLFVFDLSNGTVQKHNVAAGKNSDPDGNGYATRFSNTPNSKMSSLGFYQTLHTYTGGHGLSLRLRGLSGTNSNVEARDVVMHPANYVSDSGRAGRSWGCPAIDPAISQGLIAKVKNGAMLLIDR